MTITLINKRANLIMGRGKFKFKLRRQKVSKGSGCMALTTHLKASQGS